MTADIREDLVALPSGEQVLLRPIRPADAAGLEEFLHRMAPEDVRMRFFAPIREFSPALLHRLVNPDPEREAAIIAHPVDSPEILAVGRLGAEPGAREVEYAITARTDMKGHGLGYMLMGRLIEIARKRGYPEIFGYVLRDNERMLRICEEYGFHAADAPHDPEVLRVSLRLG
jgi:GNAT superfamily N-acetyltransferase